MTCALLVSACAPRIASRTPSDLDGALLRWAAEDERGPSSATLRAEDPRPARLAPPDREVPRGRVIDVHFQDASLASALTMLADAANVGLVIGGGVNGTVSIDLRRVRPLDAMRALAEAHGVELSLVGSTVVARGAGL